MAAVVLAAGTSSRMGRNKLLLEVEGEPLVRRSVRRVLGAGLDPVVVVLGHQAGEVTASLAGLDCLQILNSGYEAGMTSSLRAGIAALPESTAAAVVVLADMPCVSAAMLAAVAEAYRQERQPIVVSSYGAAQAPPTLFGRELFAELLALPDGAKPESVVRKHADELLTVPQPPEALLDLDLPADLRRLDRA